MTTKTKSVFGWLAEKVSGAVDAPSGVRVAHQATQVQSLLRQRQRQFDSPQAVRELAISKSDQAGRHPPGQSLRL